MWARVSYLEFRDIAAGTRSFDEIAAFSGSVVTVSDERSFSRIYEEAQVTANCFRLLGQQPIVGRDFTTADESPDAPPVVALTYGLWERRYGKDPNLIGQTIRLNGVPTTVIGVMPHGLTFPSLGNFAELWRPFIRTANADKRDARNLVVVGHLAPGVAEKTAQAEVETLARTLERTYPLTNAGMGFVLSTFHERFFGPQGTAVFLAMLGAAALLLLIACANVANLLLARSLARTRDMAVRIALGAGRWRVIRQILVESLLVSVAAGVLGWVVAQGAVRTFDFVVTEYQPSRPLWIDFSMDTRVWLYLAGISLGIGMLVGLAPALRLAKVDLSATLKDGGRTVRTDVRSRRLSGLLIIIQTALAVVLLAGVGLMGRSFLNIYHAPLGVNAANVLTMSVALPSQAKYLRPEDQIAFYERLKTRLASLSEVESVALASHLPTSGASRFPFELDNSPVDGARRPTLSAVTIDPDYFRVWQVRPSQGRSFMETDDAAEMPVVIVNEAFASRSWPGDNAIGRRLRLFRGDMPEGWRTVVGIVPNIVQNDVSPRQIDPLVYVPFKQMPRATLRIMVRARVATASLAAFFQRAVQALDPDVPVTGVLSMDERLAQNYWFLALFGTFFAIFAAVAAILAAVGVCAIVAQAASRRTQEIGVRMALGASAGNVLKLIFVQGMRPVAVGSIVGLGGAFMATRFLRILIRVSPTDPATFIGSSAVLIALAALGCVVPAWRAARIQPMSALRHD